MPIKNGVSKYASGTASVTVFFPDEKVCCNYCLFCKYEDSYKRYSCRITDEWLLYPFHGIGANCPLKFEGGKQ
jgi:hypothetical protein